MGRRPHRFWDDTENVLSAPVGAVARGNRVLVKKPESAQPEKDQKEEQQREKDLLREDEPAVGRAGTGEDGKGESGPFGRIP